MSATVKNTFKFQTTGIGSLPSLKQEDWLHCLDQVDIPFYPEFPTQPGHMILDYSLGLAQTQRQIIFEDFCDYLKQKNKVACKLQWCGLLTFAHYRSEINQYLNTLTTLEEWVSHIKRELPSIQKIYIFVDEPALGNADLSKMISQQLIRYKNILSSLAADLYVHCCGPFPEVWPEIYNDYGLSFDLAINSKTDGYFLPFSKLALGIFSQHSYQISSALLERTQLVTPPCGLTSYSKSQVIEILSNLHQF